MRPIRAPGRARRPDPRRRRRSGRRRARGAAHARAREPRERSRSAAGAWSGGRPRLRVLLADPYVQEATALRTITLALVGIGTVEPSPMLARAATCSRRRARGAERGWRGRRHLPALLRRGRRSCLSTFNDRVIGISLHQLRGTRGRDRRRGAQAGGDSWRATRPVDQRPDHRYAIRASIAMLRHSARFHTSCRADLAMPLYQLGGSVLACPLRSIMRARALAIFVTRHGLYATSTRSRSERALLAACASPASSSSST